MTRIICRASDCIYWEEGICSSEKITYDPEQGCLTHEGIEDVLLEDEEEWEDDDILDDEALDWVEEDDDLLDLDEDEIDEEDWDV
jgi:hypothetical protein